ncbi:MAG: hypothetical protein QM736_26835 [Vicinamibacterales bacterium]
MALSLVGANHAADTAVAADVVSRTISVRLHDYALLDDDELLAAERQVADIYASVGVLIDWRQPVRPARITAGIEEWPRDPAATLTVLVVTSPMAHGIGVKNDVAGYAAVSPTDGGSVAFVVADRTRRIAESGGVPHTRVLSQVIAHELAHLLMPDRPHSHDGIMRATWHPIDFRYEMTRAFSRAEAEIIRRGVARLSRLAHQTAN